MRAGECTIAEVPDPATFANNNNNNNAARRLRRLGGAAPASASTLMMLIRLDDEKLENEIHIAGASEGITGGYQTSYSTGEKKHTRGKQTECKAPQTTLTLVD